jgi:hypothetical protein
MHLEMATRVPSTATAKMSIHSTIAARCTRGIASKQTPCVCTRDPAPRTSAVLNLIVLVDPQVEVFVLWD